MSIVLPEFNETDLNAPILTNFQLNDENWEMLKTFLDTFIDSLPSYIGPAMTQEIVNQVITNLGRIKTVINIPQLTTGSTVQITANNIVFNINRSTDLKFIITKAGDLTWDTRDLYVQSSISTGIGQGSDTQRIMNPLIDKSQGEIDIYFDVAISTGFKIIIL